MEHLTSGNIALAFVIVLSILRFIAPRTGSTADDKIVAGIDTGLAWLRENMPDAYHKVEVAARGGALTCGSAKLAAYLWELNQAHIDDHGVPMPVALIEQAARRAAGKAAEDKSKTQTPVPVGVKLPDPPAGPASA